VLTYGLFVAAATEAEEQRLSW